MICRVGLTSDTMVRKAQKLLTINGYRCEVIRLTGRSAEGCTFGLRVFGNCEEASSLLKQAGMDVRSLRTERGDA